MNLPWEVSGRGEGSVVNELVVKETNGGRGKWKEEGNV